MPNNYDQVNQVVMESVIVKTKLSPSRALEVERALNHSLWKLRDPHVARNMPFDSRVGNLSYEELAKLLISVHEAIRIQWANTPEDGTLVFPGFAFVKPDGSVLDPTLVYDNHVRAQMGLINALAADIDSRSRGDFLQGFFTADIEKTAIKDVTLPEILRLQTDILSAIHSCQISTRAYNWPARPRDLDDPSWLLGDWVFRGPAYEMDESHCSESDYSDDAGEGPASPASPAHESSDNAGEGPAPPLGEDHPADLIEFSENSSIEPTAFLDDGEPTGAGKTSSFW